MKVAIAYLTKDRVELTKQTLPVLADGQHALFWYDGSSDPEALEFYKANRGICTGGCEGVKGGADAAIVFALTDMLGDPANYSHVGLCESDVLLLKDWFGPTMALFGRGSDEGLCVGAVSARCYEDRILCQRDGYALCHNLGAGHVIFTREAAQLILANYRSSWWPHSRALFAQLASVDIGRWAAFRGNEQWTTRDWGFDAVLAQAGLASLALTPSPCDMIGQEPSLEEQGLKLAATPVEILRNGEAFHTFAVRSAQIRSGEWKPDVIRPIHQQHGQYIYFAHQLPDARWGGDWRLKWCQGFGPFAYRANVLPARLTVSLFGPVLFLLSGGKTGGKVTITDTESGYEIAPALPAGDQIASLQVPAGVSYREIVMTCDEGVVFHGVQTTESQPITNHKFDFNSLPPV